MKGTALLAALTVQRLAELVLARRNTKKLLAKGAYEVGAPHYKVIVAMHAAWLAALWLRGRKRDVSTPFLLMFGALQLARIWTLRTLGERWTTRVIILPGTKPIASGPYRFVKHPNYLIVALELPCVPLALGLRPEALIFGLLNLAVLQERIRYENTALDGTGPDEQQVAG